MNEYQAELDARGMNCPLPIIRARKSIDALQTGEVLRVVATDPGAVKDFDAFCQQTGNQLLSSGQNGDTYIFLIRKG